MSTDLIQERNTHGTLQPERRLIRDGVAGNWDTIYAMIRLIRQSCEYDLGLEGFIAHWLISHNYDSYTPAQQIFSSLYKFVQLNVKYVQDVAGRVESIKNARQTLLDGYGDCDDQAILNATLLGDLGYEDVRICMTKYDPAAESFQHVYTVCYVDDKRYVFDTTLPHGSLNEEVPGAVDKREIPVFKDVAGLDGLSGIYNNVRHIFKSSLKGVVRALPTVSAFVPIGFAASHAFDTGANLLQKTFDSSKLSLSATGSEINQHLNELIQMLLRSEIAHDLAQTYALQIAAQLAAVPQENGDSYTRDIVGASIKTKLAFIKNFPEFAKENGIEVVHLNHTLMLISGLAIVGGISGFLAYRYYQRGR